MYRYDEFDAEFVRQRVAQFRDQVGRRLSGELTEDEFKPLRLQNGVYLQLHAYMLRIAIPYGTLSSRQMRKLAHIARTYDRGYGHFTTRQNLQFNWPKPADIPDILAELADVEMHAIQTSGNCIRNVTADHFAGATADEVVDPRPYAEIIRQWSSLHPEFSFLPRKFKVAVTAAEHDRAAIKVHDIGLHLKRLASGGIGFAVYVGGGQGRTPMIAKLIRDDLPEEDLLSYLEAVLRVYNLLRPARQQLQGAHQDPGARPRRRGLRARGGRGVAAHPRRRAQAARGRDPAHRGLLRAARLRRAGRRGPRCARRTAPSTAGSRATRTPTSSRATPSSRSRSSPSAACRAMPAPSRWRRSPTSPSATRSTRCASPTSRTWCCRTWPRATCGRSIRR